MKGKYNTNDGIVEVLEFDEKNNMAYVTPGDGTFRWCGKPEFSHWEKLFTGEETTVEVPAAPMPESLPLTGEAQTPEIVDVEEVAEEATEEAPAKKAPKSKTKKEDK